MRMHGPWACLKKVDLPLDRASDAPVEQARQLASIVLDSRELHVEVSAEVFLIFGLLAHEPAADIHSGSS